MAAQRGCNGELSSPCQDGNEIHTQLVRSTKHKEEQQSQTTHTDSKEPKTLQRTANQNHKAQNRSVNSKDNPQKSNCRQMLRRLH